MFLNKKNTLGLFIALLIFLAPQFVWACQLRIIDPGAKNINISQAESSQAFYATKTKQPQVYKIVSDKPFVLYVNIRVPRISGIQKDLTANIYRKTDLADEYVGTLDSRNFQWTEFYEPFTNDSYYKGPEIRQEVGAGTYFIQVDSPAISACPPQPEREIRKYVLVVGEKKEFPLKEAFSLIRVLPAEKIFFNKSPFLAYYNRVGLFMFIPVLVIALVIFFIIRSARKRKK